MDGSYIHYTYDAAGTLLRKGYYVGEELTEIPGDDEEELTGFRLPDTHLTMRRKKRSLLRKRRRFPIQTLPIIAATTFTRTAR